MRASAIAGIVALSVCAVGGQIGTKQHDTTQSPQRPPSTAIRDALTSVMSLTVFDSQGTPLAQGSGFLVDSRGTLVTNYHVIEYAYSAMAKSTTGAFYKVKGVLALDSSNDLAVLRLDGTGFTYLRVGNSDTIEVGDRVIAIGSPLGLEASVSDGVVSAVRTLDARPVIQMTAAISPGSSGGALLNTKGEVIGVTTFNVAGGQNLNFAVPTKYVKPLLAPQTILPFSPKQPPPQGTKDPGTEKAKGTTVATDLPRYWLNTHDGKEADIRVEGDYIYEQITYSEGGLGDAEVFCETKRNEDRWVGKCNYTITFRYDYKKDPLLCAVEVGEVISSVKSHRIEGKSQAIDYPPAGNFRGPDTCPIPGSTWKEFALIPK